MKIKVIYTILFLIFVSISSFFYWPEYNSFLQEKKYEKALPDFIENEKENFSFDKIKLINDVNFYATPNLNFLDFLVKKIDNASNRVYVNMYIFTEKRLRESLLKAKNRGVDIKIVLEKNVYNAPNLNFNTFNEFQKSGIDVQWSRSENYGFNHAKFMIIDDEWVVGTGNFSYTTFKTNKDFFLIGKDALFLNKILSLFESNFVGEKKYFSDYSFLQSPFSSRFKLEALIKEANKTIDMYAPYITDENISFLLEEKVKKGVKVSIITNNEELDNNKLGYLKNIGAEIYFSKKTIHAKSILVDSKYLYMGSINFSANSMDKNMELGFFIINKEIITPFKEIFANDFINKK